MLARALDMEHCLVLSRARARPHARVRDGIVDALRRREK